jgi:hypothetical protein
MRKLGLAAIAALGLVATSGAARADVIDFNALPTGAAGDPLVLPGATFTALGGFNVIAVGGLCTSLSADNSFNCSPDLQVDFDQASSGVSFSFFANNEHTIGADIGDVSIFSGATLLATLDLIVLDASGATRDLVALLGYSDVTRLLVSSTDFGGVLYDDFTFTPGGAVPEPGAWALMIGGFAVAGTALRRRTQLA